MTETFFVASQTNPVLVQAVLLLCIKYNTFFLGWGGGGGIELLNMPILYYCIPYTS